jgi:predicted hydrocarbon binding protein
VGRDRAPPARHASASVRTISGETPTEDDCVTATGWLTRAIELSGGKGVAVEETRCRARGADCCEHACRWT